MNLNIAGLGLERNEDLEMSLEKSFAHSNGAYENRRQRTLSLCRLFYFNFAQEMFLRNWPPRIRADEGELGLRSNGDHAKQSVGVVIRPRGEE